MIDARREAYNRVKNIMIPNMFYRTDIGERWTRDGGPPPVVGTLVGAHGVPVKLSCQTQ